MWGRGGLGLEYEIELRRGEATASFVMDHGRTGPLGALGGREGEPNSVTVWRDGKDVQTWWDLTPGIKKPESFALALAGATGVSSSSSHTVPAGTV